MNAQYAQAIAVLLAVNALIVPIAVGQKASAQPQASDLPEQAQRWLDVFNSGDFSVMEKYSGAAADDAKAREDLLMMYQTFLISRGIDASGVEDQRGTELTISGTERLSGDPVHVILDLSGSQPRLRGVRLLPPAPDARLALSQRSEAEMLSELDKQVTHSSSLDVFSGAILVGKDGEIIFNKAWGVANKVTSALNRTDTKFNLASCGKMFTAVAVLQLAQAGKLSLEDAVGKLLPDYKNEDVRNKVTVRQLLSHTSGMGDIFTDEFEKRRTEVRTVADWVSLFETAPLKFEPGTQWAYSNAGFCLLGAIVEKVSGQDYYTYLDEHIFKPAGMTSTGAFETDKPVDNLAIGYTRMGATSPEQLRDRIPNTDIHSVKGSPAGGSYSTVEDLAKFANALLNHKLLNAELTQLAMTPQFQNVRNADPYGLGFGVEDIEGHRVIGHGGGFPGISTSFDMFPDDGYVVVVMSNYDMVARRYSMQLREWITAQPARAESTGK